MRFLLLLAAGGLLASGLPAQPRGSREERAVRELIAAYVEAREQRDAQRLASLLAPEADQLVSSGEWRRGRAELVRGMLASSASNTGARTIEVESVRLVAPGVAIADGRYEIAGAPGAPPRRMWTSFLARRDKDGVWRILAIRNMLPAPAR